MKKLALVMIVLVIGLSGCVSGTKKQEDNVQEINNTSKTEQQDDKSDLDALKNMYGTNLVPISNSPPVYIQTIPEIPKESFYWKNKVVGYISKNKEITTNSYSTYKPSTIGEGILRWINDNSIIEPFIYLSVKNNMAVCFFSFDDHQSYFETTDRRQLEFDMTISGKLVFFFLGTGKFYWHELSKNAFPLTKELPFLMFDIDNNGIIEIHFKHDNNIYEIIELGEKLLEFKLSMNADSNGEFLYGKGNPLIIKTYKEYGTGDCIMAMRIGSVAGFVCPDHESRIHLVKVSGEDLIDVSYMFPNILRGLWTPERLRNSFEKYIFLEQTGPLNQYKRNALVSKIKEKRKIEIAEKIVPIQVKNSFEHEEWYDRDVWLHPDNFSYNRFKYYEDALKTLREAIEEKSILYFAEIENILFNSDEEIKITPYSPYEFEPFSKRTWEIEPGSYWPERRLGKHKMVKVNFNNDRELPAIRPDNLEKDIIRFANATYGGTKFVWGRGNFIAEECSYKIVPASENIMFIIVGPVPCITAVKLGNEKNNYKPTQLMDWIEGEMAIIVNGIGDVNCDGITDFIFQFQNFGATENTNDTATFSVINGKLHQLVMDVEGLRSVEYFFGSFGGRGHYGTLELGCAPVPDNFTGRSHASMKFSSMHRMELREDGFIYDVTYNYPTSEHTSAVKEMLTGEYLDRYQLCDCETVGLSKIALKNIPKGSECNDDDCRIYRDCLLLGKTYYVQSPEDAIKNWSIYYPQR
ncbi:MAG TPA: hypothetical protein PL190_02400 [Caldisericia bacterium]|nr:MAG: hypothetical protein BWX90_00793 [bacterium ADurb.Bin132]HNY60842.1 hypothetical protein [Caldisericia bacterium]HOC79952.1 hypothetical protein [Caldisericia bacterium]HOG69883.1 hypothetical protein [Caldisericia bacterium]HPA65368.1 hypothetical protein [Caldisericia bacterium]